MIRIFRNIIGSTVILDIFVLILLFLDGSYSETLGTFTILFVTMIVTFLLTKYIEKVAYKVHQKHYAVVIVSNEWDEYNKLEEDQDLSERPLNEQENVFFETGKVSTTYALNLLGWNEKRDVVSITEDPTFLVISDNFNAKSEKAMQKPFVVTSNPKEVLQFLERNK